MFQSEKLSVSVDFTEETRKSLEYVLSFATEIGAQFIVLQVMERKAERYSLIFPVALLEKWPFAGKSVPTIPVSALPQDKSADLAGVIKGLTGRGDFVVCLGAGNITQWAYALPGELKALG